MQIIHKNTHKLTLKPAYSLKSTTFSGPAFSCLSSYRFPIFRSCIFGPPLCSSQCTVNRI